MFAKLPYLIMTVLLFDLVLLASQVNYLVISAQSSCSEERKQSHYLG